MTITLQDRSNYFKGLLLLIRKDKVVTEPEVALMLRIGKALGFEKEFCTNAINEILENTYIDDTPPLFSTPAVAMKFISDGLKISFVDHERIDPSEQAWLQSTAEKNGIDPDTLVEALRQRGQHTVDDERLEVDDLLKAETDGGLKQDPRLGSGELPPQQETSR